MGETMHENKYIHKNRERKILLRSVYTYKKKERDTKYKPKIVNEKETE